MKIYSNPRKLKANRRSRFSPRSRSTNSTEKHRKKDKKNIVKNIVKIFIAWIEKKKIEQDPELENERFSAEMKELLNKESFNNRLIKKMI